MTGKPIDAKTAEDIGLINRCMEDGALDGHVQGMAESLRDFPPHAVNYTKTALNLVLKQTTAVAFEASLAYEIYTMKMSDHEEALRAFVEKRTGTYTGS